MEKESLFQAIRWAAVIIFFLWLIIYLRILKKEDAFKMNSDPLTEQRLFWAAIIAPVVGFVAFGIIAWVGHSPQLDGDGLNNFIEISKFPLAILSLSGFFGIIVNNVHRTIQTDDQIKEAQRKNKIDAFYAHRKNTLEILGNAQFKTIKVSQSTETLKLHNSYSAYLYFYPNASTENNNFEINSISIASILICFKKIGTLVLEPPEEDNPYGIYEWFSKIEDILTKTHRNLQLEPIKIKNTFATAYKMQDGTMRELRTKFENEKDIKSAIDAYWETFNTLILIFGVSVYSLIRSDDNIQYALSYAVGTQELCFGIKLDRISSRTDCGNLYPGL